MPDSARTRVRATQDRRRSNAAGPHDHQPTRGAIERAVIDAELVADEPDPVDLDEIVDAEVVETGPLPHRCTIECSPLYGKTRLARQIVEDADAHELARLRGRYATLPWWARLLTPKPAGW